ncbi:MAG: alpha/beta hydrolase, partial [Xanthomonadales bacterium]|nr:alpha/beta hydrolase [Xanthomonadales bacterium]
EGPRTLLCLPGLARTARDFEGLAGRIPPGWRLLCPDHRGRGRSARDPRPGRYHTATYARDALEWLDHLRVEQAAVLGTSFGGWVALTLAANHPERISGVILNDIGVTVPRAAALQYMERMARRTTPESVDPAFNRQMGQARRLAPFLGVLCRLGLMRHSAPLVTGYRDTLRRVEAPLLVLHGARSRVLTEAGIRELRAACPGMTLATIPGVGHTPTGTEPESVEAVQAFLTGLQSSASG